MADKRLTPARSDLAAAYLKGRVEAARFADGEKFSICHGRASLRARPADSAAQDSELLFGEIVTAYEQKDGWSWVQAQSDEYVGYVRSGALGPKGEGTSRVIALMTPVFPSPDLKAPTVDFLPLNAMVRHEGLEGDYVRIAGGKFVHYRHLAPADEHSTDFVAVAERFVGVPYVWGGKTFAGLDCSGLIQTALNASGVTCPRDTDMQERALGARALGEGARSANLKRGDLVFWKGHVGVMQNATHLLHANAFHMQVAAEPLAEAMMRIEKIAGPVTSIKRF